MLLGVSPLGVYALTQLPSGAGNVSFAVDSGALTLTGKDASLRLVTVLAGDKGDLTLAGQTSTFATITATVKGDLTLTGRNAVFVTLLFGDGTLTLTGQDAALTPTVIAVAATLTLTPHWADLLLIGGGGSGKKKPRTGFEPVIKRPRPPEKPEPPKVWTPPAPARSPSIAPRPAPNLIDPELVPLDLIGIMDQMRSAEDISDAADIADILALLD